MDSSLSAILRVTLVIGMAGSVAAIYAYFRIPMFRIHLARMFCIIALWYLADHLSKLVSNFALTSDDEASCQRAGYFVQITALGSLLSILFLVVELWLLVVRRWTVAKVKRLDVLFVTLSLLAPLATAAALAIAKPLIEADDPLFGKERLWCWISRKHPTTQLLALYIPMYGSILIILAAFYHMGLVVYQNALQKRISRSELDDQKRDPLMHFAKGATVYVGVFILCWIPGSLSRFYTMVTGESSEVLLGIQAVFTGLRGLFHFLCFYYMAWSQRDRTAKVAATISFQVTDDGAK